LPEDTEINLGGGEINCISFDGEEVRLDTKIIELVLDNYEIFHVRSWQLDLYRADPDSFAGYIHRAKGNALSEV
jgi:hypothetical protein